MSYYERNQQQKQKRSRRNLFLNEVDDDQDVALMLENSLLEHDFK